MNHFIPEANTTLEINYISIKILKFKSTHSNTYSKTSNSLIKKLYKVVPLANVPQLYSLIRYEIMLRATATGKTKLLYM